MDSAGAVLLDLDESPQVPTYMWLPDYSRSMGVEAVDFATDAGLLLDDYQKLALDAALAVDDFGQLLLFELAIILSRQNGKGTFLEALELAWLFLFNYKLVMHSAHLFETSREHFLRMQVLIASNPQFDSRVSKIKEGRGSEEIIMRDGARLKFMTRKGGAGRGFTGVKNVYDECMYLEALSMSAGLPALATQPDAQVIYAGSAGLGAVSSQLGAVRHRAYAPTRVGEDGRPLPGDPALGYLEWAINKPVYDENGRRIAGDDPEDPRVIVRVNPAMAPSNGRPPRIAMSFVQKEARALGGLQSPDWWRERLGVGDYPEEEEIWAVIAKTTWQAAAHEVQPVLTRCRKVLAVAGDPDRGTSALAMAVRLPDGTAHIESVERHRGTAWLAPRAAEIVEGLRKDRKDEDDWLLADDGQPVIILKGDVTEHVDSLLVEAWVATHVATAGEYAQGCQALTEAIRLRTARHRGDQVSLNKAVATAERASGEQGGWRWVLDTAQDSSPLRAVTLALLGLDRFAPKEDSVGDVW